MGESVYKIITLVAPARNPGKRQRARGGGGRRLRACAELRVAEIDELDMVLEDGKVRATAPR